MKTRKRARRGEPLSGDRPAGVVRRFTMTTDADREASADGRIDTGADRTVVTSDVSCRLDAVKQTLGKIETQLPGGAVLVGFEFPVTVRVLHRTARIRAFAPLYFETTSKDARSGKVVVVTTPSRQEGNLIGEDFMRVAAGKLDYAKPGREFSGTANSLGPLKFIKASPAHAALADYYMKRLCRPSRTPRKPKK